ncbi:FixH family protein [Pontibacillus yanchengensis]|uniref:YtkA-like domain-containing protein n=1 Tax=Pontibacillus yanchengensis Y32 TaxID=1385514 RepID=A0A0A2T6F6_9BACI|nr:FixH family protein [Pontibacillus yanchengensis]KGP71089.1 hypothetical protein N782_21770 [Pontibacillus yanchengensis Y32]
MKKQMCLGMMLFVLLLAACESKPSSGEATKSDNIKIKVMTVPEDIKPGEVSTLQAKVTMDGEKVNDTEKVEFTLWQEGSNEHQQRESKMQGKGIYSFQHTFEEKGIYNLSVRVTANGTHKKVQEKLEVGEVNAEEKEES